MKHKKPISNTPSKNFIKYFDLINVNKNKPILDVPCGYGRNGQYCVEKGYECIFCDYDIDAITFINNELKLNKNNNEYNELYKTIQIDLQNDKWEFNKNSCSGIINVHYYQENLIPLFLSTIDIGGFLYIETIDARGYNFIELPEYKSIYNLMKDRFQILFYKEKIVKPELLNRATLKIFGIKKF